MNKLNEKAPRTAKRAKTKKLPGDRSFLLQEKESKTILLLRQDPARLTYQPFTSI